MNPSATLRRPTLTAPALPGLASVAARAAQVAQAARQAIRPAPAALADALRDARLNARTDADKGPKEPDGFEVWHHHQSVRDPAEFDRMVKLDERR